MPVNVRVTGAPRQATQPLVGYGYAMPLSEVPPPEWTKLFDAAWSPSKAMSRVPRFDENGEVLISIDLSDQDAARATLDGVVELVDRTTVEHNTRELQATEDAQRDKEAQEVRVAATKDFFADWWSGLGQSSEN